MSETIVNISSASPLTENDIEQFAEQGFVRLPSAFDAADALAMQDAVWSAQFDLHGIDRQDRSTWNVPYPGQNMNRYATLPIFGPTGSPRLCGAIDRLLGAGRWNVPNSWGMFAITYPQFTAADTANCTASGWRLPVNGWHFDGHSQRFADRLSYLFVFTFYTDVQPRGGGTLIAAGSHRLVNEFCVSHDPEGTLKKNTLQKRIMQSSVWLRDLTSASPEATEERNARFMDTTTVELGVPLRVVELTGSPGDAILCHPLILHAVAPCCCDGPRFMRIKMLSTAGEYGESAAAS